MLVALIAMAPLQGMRAAIEMMPVTDMGQPQSMQQQGMPMSMHQQSVDIKGDHCVEKCKNCEQCRCSDRHLCHQGQCFSSSVFILSSFDFNFEFMIQAQPSRYTGHFPGALPSLLFRPPRT